jgi:lipopolysaccharide export system protein LptC
MINRTLIERLRSWLPLIPPLLLLAGTYWLNLQVQPISVKTDNSKRHDIDYSVQNVSSVTLDETGKPHHLLTTKEMWHYPDDDTTHLQSPKFVSLSKERAPIVMTSDLGKISSHGDEVFLYDNVKVLRMANDAQGSMEFTSDYLRIIPNKDQADTDRPVTITTPHDVVRGVGMQLDNKLRTITLLSDVRATHESIKK